jgi:hypothetical protein
MGQGSCHGNRLPTLYPFGAVESPTRGWALPSCRSATFSSKPASPNSEADSGLNCAITLSSPCESALLRATHAGDAAGGVHSAGCQGGNQKDGKASRHGCSPGGDQGLGLQGENAMYRSSQARSALLKAHGVDRRLPIPVTPAQHDRVTTALRNRTSGQPLVSFSRFNNSRSIRNTWGSSARSVRKASARPVR